MTPPAFHAHYDARRLRPGLAISVALFATGVVTGFLGVWMGWILAAFMLWTVATLLRRRHRAGPVVTIDAEGTTDHRVPLAIAWPDVKSMRTVDRRVVGVKVPLLELVPATPHPRAGRALLAAVLRGDIAFSDARDRGRIMIDLRHLDATPEQVLQAARDQRS